MSKLTKAQNRERSTGRYSFDGDLDRLCVCGHPLGLHMGEAPHDCAVSTFSDIDPNKAECDCPRFRPARRAALAGRE